MEWASTYSISADLPLAIASTSTGIEIENDLSTGIVDLSISPVYDPRNCEFDFSLPDQQA